MPGGSLNDAGQPAADALTRALAWFGRYLQSAVVAAVATLAVGLAVIYALSRAGIVAVDRSLSAESAAMFDWAITNLGSSLPVFVALLIAFLITLAQLRRALRGNFAVSRVVQLDQLSDIWTTLFFGAGVIWTAIGMRSALIFALGDRAAAQSAGAFAMLERLIDGGILLALSTTIFGGVGGYLLRLHKTISIGAELQACYDRAARVDSTEMRASLQRIEQLLVRQ